MDICPAEPTPHESEVSDQAPQSPPPLQADPVSRAVTTQPERAASEPPDADQVTPRKTLAHLFFRKELMFNILLIKNSHCHIFHNISLVFLCDLYSIAI